MIGNYVTKVCSMFFFLDKTRQKLVTVLVLRLVFKWCLHEKKIMKLKRETLDNLSEKHDKKRSST